MRKVLLPSHQLILVQFFISIPLENVTFGKDGLILWNEFKLQDKQRIVYTLFWQLCITLLSLISMVISRFNNKYSLKNGKFCKKFVEYSRQAYWIFSLKFLRYVFSELKNWALIKWLHFTILSVKKYIRQ